MRIPDHRSHSGPGRDQVPQAPMPRRSSPVVGDDDRVRPASARSTAEVTGVPAVTPSPESIRSRCWTSVRIRVLVTVAPSRSSGTTSQCSETSSTSRRPSASAATAVTSTTSPTSRAASTAASAAPPGRTRTLSVSNTGTGASGDSRSTRPSRSTSRSESPSTTTRVTARTSGPCRSRRTTRAREPGGSPAPWRPGARPPRWPRPPPPPAGWVRAPSWTTS